MIGTKTGLTPAVLSHSGFGFEMLNVYMRKQKGTADEKNSLPHIFLRDVVPVNYGQEEGASVNVDFEK